MKIKSFLYKSLLVAFVVLTKVTLFAQPSVGPPSPGGGSTGTNPPCWQPECVPIDGGVIFLMAAGTLLAIKMLYNQRIKSRA